jgi:glucose-6-phosphate 1-dehydrogenase
MNGDERPADALVVFGVTGDLAHRMTLPSLYRLARRKELFCRVIGVGRSPWSTDEFRERSRKAVVDAGLPVDDAAMDDFCGRLTFIQGDIEDPAAFERLREELGDARTVIHYLALPPDLFAEVAHRLGDAGLAKGARLVVEKPFGTDLASAIKLDEELHEVFREEQIYRLDHFLGKEPVQDILYLRFANEIFEPIWNRHHIESVQISMFESFGVEDRGSFYDGVGALRDVVQNHLLQVLALVAMEAPAGGQSGVADRRRDVFHAMPDADPSKYVRGQYKGYRDIEGVAKDSDVETYAALELRVDNWRWADIPWVIRAGKALSTTATDVTVRYRKAPPLWWTGERAVEIPKHNHVTFRIGKDAGANIGVLVKRPGEASTERVHLDLSFEEQLGDLPAPYERLLRDAMVGRDELFPRADAIEQTWRILQPLLDHPPPLVAYEPGSDGPPQAETIAEEQGGWRPPHTAE